jgi:sugar phosphate isomerase/epimerase
MQIGLITDSVGHLTFDDALDVAQRLGLHSVEVATGNWSEAPHINLTACWSQKQHARTSLAASPTGDFSSVP